MAINQDDLLNLKPKDKPYRVLDGGGLFLAVLPDGAMFWRLRYQLTTKETITLGKYPKYSLAEARQWRTHCAELVSLGISPRALKQGNVTPTNFAPKEKNLATIFLNNWCRLTVEKMQAKDEEVGEEITLEAFAKNLDAEIAERAKNNPDETGQMLKNEQDLTTSGNAKTDAKPEQDNQDTTQEGSNMLKRLFSFVSGRKK